MRYVAEDRLTAGLVRLATRLAWTAGAALCAVTTAAGANAIVDSKGFEDPPYDLAVLEGQNDWQLSHYGWPGDTGPGTATVQNTVKQAGTQAVQVDRAAYSDDRWAVLPGGSLPSGQYIVIEWDMNVTETPGDKWGPFFGSEAYDSNGAPKLLGSLGVDASTGDILYQQEVTGYLVDTGTDATFGTWGHYKIVLDYVADEYTVYYNGTSLATEGFVDGAIAGFTDADISAFAAAADALSRAALGTAYFDNFVVTPEPSSLVLMMLGGAAFFWIARRRR